jgi:predicted nucleic acid-binding protein
MTSRAIVLDANILIRAVLGKKVRSLIQANADKVKFFAPDIAFDDAKKYLPGLLQKRGVSSIEAMAVLHQIEKIVQRIDLELYENVQTQALERIAIRDANDWPVLACAMVLGCPVWTEDADFFGSGVATWTTDRIAIFLAD